MNLFKEVDCFGVYVPPFFACMVVAGVLVLFLKPWLDQLGTQHYVWNRPLFDAALFLILLSLATFLL